MTDTTFADASARLKGYEKGMVLGDLAWFSIPEITVDHAAVVRAMHKTGLDQLFLPPPPRSGDVFKRACTQSQRKRVYGSEGLKHNYMIREVGKDRDCIWRHLIREDVDAHDRKLGYVSMAEIEFDRSKNSIKVTRFVSDKNATVVDAVGEDILATVQRRYYEWNNALTACALRDLVRRILEMLHATTVRPSGGVYFVREDKHPTLEALEDTINALGSGCSFHTLPLLDDMKQREMLRRAFEDESIEEVDRKLAEIMTIRTADASITTDRYAQFGADYKRLTTKVVEYSDLLDLAMSTTASRLELYQEAIIKLMDNVRA